MSDAGSQTKLWHSASGEILVEDLMVADGFWSRTIGLMGRRSLPPTSGMLIVPCSSIHTFFMRFPLDVIYLDWREARGQVRKVVSGLRPWRLSFGWGATAVLELPAGRLQQIPVAPGEWLQLRSPGELPVPDAGPSAAAERREK